MNKAEVKPRLRLVPYGMGIWQCGINDHDAAWHDSPASAYLLWKKCKARDARNAWLNGVTKAVHDLMGSR